MTGLRAGRPGKRGGCRAKSRPAVGPVQPPTHRILEVHSAGVEEPSREEDNSPSCSVQFKDAWNYTDMSLCPGA